MKRLNLKIGDKIGKNYIVKDIVKSYKNWFRPVFWVYNKEKKCCRPYTEDEMLFVKGIKNKSNIQ